MIYFQMVRYKMGDILVVHHVHAVHRSPAVPYLLHHDPSWACRGVGWWPALVRQVHLPISSEY